MKDLVIGLCTVSNRKTSYLQATLDSLINNANDRNGMMIKLYHCDLKGQDELCVGSNQIRIEDLYENEINSGFLQIVRIDNHPVFENMPNNFGDNDTRVLWRTKQCYDYSEAFRLSHNVGKYYMHIEDDLIACKGYDSHIRGEIEKANNSWATIWMAQGGFIGWLFRNKDLPKMSSMLNVFREEMPCDWIAEYFALIMQRTGLKNIHTSYSIFQHVGTDRTLRDGICDIQPVTFTNFIG